MFPPIHSPVRTLKVVARPYTPRAFVACLLVHVCLIRLLAKLRNFRYFHPVEQLGDVTVGTVLVALRQTRVVPGRSETSVLDTKNKKGYVYERITYQVKCCVEDHNPTVSKQACRFGVRDTGERSYQGRRTLKIPFDKVAMMTPSVRSLHPVEENFGCVFIPLEPKRDRAHERGW